MKTGELLKLLHTRYAEREWAFFEQVANSTGYGASRSADAMALNLWPSRGLELHGFELKVSRGDWLRELKEPAKADELFASCDRWWVVAGDTSIVKSNELPSTWGLLVPRGGALAASVEAPKLSPAPLGKPFVAALLRRAQAALPATQVLEKVREEERKAAQTHLQSVQKQADKLAERIHLFEEKSGVRLDAWNAPKIGEAVRLVLNGGVDAELEKLAYLRQQVASLLESIDGTLVEASLKAGAA